MGPNVTIDCCGCGLCELVCPKHAVERRVAERKSLVFVKGKLCIECGICDSYCPLRKDMFHGRQDLFFRAESTDKQTLEKSASGGIAHEFSKSFLRNSGLVYGAAWNPATQRVEHMRAGSENDLEGFQGSKYVQSIITPNVYKQIKADLKTTPVLFIGTPCQVAAVRSYTHDSPNLYTVDLICHGVPSPKMLEEHLHSISDKPIQAISFRDRTTFRLYVDDGATTYTSPWEEDSYYSLYMLFASLREYCYRCKFARNERVGDVTVGDYMDDGKGYSCVVASTEKGYMMLDQIATKIESTQHDISLLVNNHAFNHPTTKHPNTEHFTALYERGGLEKAYKKAFRTFVIKHKVRTILGDDIYDIIKAVISQKR